MKSLLSLPFLLLALQVPPGADATYGASGDCWTSNGSVAPPSWQACPAGVGAGIPSGLILYTDTSCPAGWTEVAALAGKTVIATTVAAGDVGTTGGADSITPSAHAGTAVADHASHTHTYTDVIAHTHVVTSQTATTGGATSYEHGTLDTSSADAEATEVTGSTGVATGTTAGPSATLTHSVTQANAHAAMDNRSAFVRLIPCKKDA